MKYEFYCGVTLKSDIIDILERKNIKYNVSDFLKSVYFYVYSDTEDVENLLNYIKCLPETSIAKSVVYSKQEMEDANWYLLYATRMGIETKNVDFTYDAKCPFTTAYGMRRHYHLDQINSFVSNKTPKWKNRYNFCTDETGSVARIFCSDFAKEAIRKSGINGVDFMPVLKSDLKTETPDVSQLVFKNKLPLEAYEFVGEYEEDICPFCGRINYHFKEPRCDNIRLNKDMIPKGIDAFGSKIIIGWGFGEEPIVISKKFYNLIIKELKEKPTHFIIHPIG